MECWSANFVDRLGDKLEICLCGIRDFERVTEMYAVFAPKPASQGLPPADDEVCADWVKGLLKIGENLAARRDQRIIGHAALIPDPKRDAAEFVIFVHQDFRNLGIGTELSKAALERAKALGFRSVWLTVAITNFVAIRLYRKLCFEYSDMDDCERTMVIRFIS